ncbi:MAG TPA: hypothetical protein PK859_17435 [Spirochaetota bacterium]|nr:hypothetical protein [Spirochaetota bacterium]HPR48280.1 hypothetical protein [Spirochaetota bacterium]
MKMNRPVLTLFSVVTVVMIFLPLFVQAQDLTATKTRLSSLKENIEYLKSRHVDIGSVEEKYDGILKDIEHYEKNLDVEDNNLVREPLKRLIDLNIQTLDKEVTEKIDSLKRLDLLYLVMLVFGAAVGIGFAIYIVIMYNKRK